MGKQTYTASNLATGDSLSCAALRSDHAGDAEGSQRVYGGALQEPPADARGLLHSPGHLLHRPPGQGSGRPSCSLRHQRLQVRLNQICRVPDYNCVIDTLWRPVGSHLGPIAVSEMRCLLFVLLLLCGCSCLLVCLSKRLALVKSLSEGIALSAATN